MITIKEKEVKANLIYSNKFHNYLSNMISIEKINKGSYENISKIFEMYYTLQNFSFIDITDKEDTISFTNVGRIFKYYKTIEPNLNTQRFNDYINAEIKIYKCIPYIKNYKGAWNIGRYEMKIGKFVKRMLPNLSDKSIEIFVNKYKALYKLKQNPRLEIVKGISIKKWYNQDNYLYTRQDKEGLGTLGKSCMRYGYDFFDLYTENEDVCSLLILKSEDETKIIGRALIWKLEDNNYYMDRIYTHFDSDTYIFFNYAKERGWLTYTELYNTTNKLNISLQKSEFKKYPYMDTFCYLDIDNKYLYSYYKRSAVSLRNTDGSYA